MKVFILTALLLLALNYAGDYLHTAGWTYWPVFGFLMYGVVAVYITHLVVGWKVKRNG